MTALDPAANVVSIRRARPDDAAACGVICYNAFATINAQHNFAPEIPSVEAATELMGFLFNHAGFYSLVAEVEGKIAGSNCLDVRTPIAGVGPVTVDPTAQNNGIGRKLMTGVLDYAKEHRFAGVRLVQSAFHARSLSLYVKLGFQVREPLALMRGAAIGLTPPGVSTRLASNADFEVCNRLCAKIHGVDRAGELKDAIAHGTATVVERNGRLAGYATVIGFFGHAVAETTEDVQALIAAAPAFAGAGILVPTRNTQLFQWCLANGLRVIQPLTLMSIGLYNEPVGAYLPSIGF
ncbi:MAG: GNAT family N-acetyltransferase [Acidobacteria bacterium]|nr:GNAT family N-acetyltransferase [Acidobacteriota bacterium]